jgi:hypothetical protein
MSVFQSSAAAANKRSEIECGSRALGRESIRVLYDLSSPYQALGAFLLDHTHQVDLFCFSLLPHWWIQS